MIVEWMFLGGWFAVNLVFAIFSAVHEKCPEMILAIIFLALISGTFFYKGLEPLL